MELKWNKIVTPDLIYHSLSDKESTAHIIITERDGVFDTEFSDIKYDDKNKCIRDVIKMKKRIIQKEIENRNTLDHNLSQVLYDL